MYTEFAKLFGSMFSFPAESVRTQAGNDKLSQPPVFGVTLKYNRRTFCTGLSYKSNTKFVE